MFRAQPERRTIRSRRPWVLVAVLAFVLVLVQAPAGIGLMPSASAGSPGASPAQSSPGLSATVTWNGANVDTAGSASSALSVSFSSSANVVFNWSGSASSSITDARLQMIYFGAALATRDVSPLPTIPRPVGTGSAVMSWTPGALTYVLEGVFKITASVLNSNGSTVWSENFFVRENAPYFILAALPIILLAIGAWELYEVARSGRLSALPKRGAPPPAAPPPTTPPAAAPPGPPSQPPATETPPANPPEGSQ